MSSTREERLRRLEAEIPAAALEWEESRRACYRSRILPEQLDRARRRYEGLLREAIRGRRFDLLTPKELGEIDATPNCGNGRGPPHHRPAHQVAHLAGGMGCHPRRASAGVEVLNLGRSALQSSPITGVLGLPYSIDCSLSRGVIAVLECGR